MRAGKLDREITINSTEAGEPLPDGTPTTGTVTGRTVRAQLIEASTEEYQRAYGEGGNTSIIFRIRWMDDIEVDQHIAYGGKVLNIREIKEIGRRNGLELRCEEVRT